MRPFAAALAALALFASADASAAAVTLKTSDGVTIKGTDYGKGANGIVLVHDKGRSSSDWQFFADKLSQAGYHVVAIDLRGHGASKPPDTLTDDDYKLMTADVEAAVQWLHGKGATKIAIVGANLGANLALATAAEDPLVGNLVLLSPGLNISGVTVGSAIDKYGDRPMLLVCSGDDSYALRSVNYIDEKAAGDAEVEILDNAGSGARMLDRDASLEGKLVAWLSGNYKLTTAKGQPATVKTTGDSTDIKTTGKAFGAE